MKRKKRLRELVKLQEILQSEFCLVCSGIDQISNLRREMELLGLSVFVVSSSVVREVLKVPLGGNVLVIHGSSSVLIQEESNLRKVRGITVLYRVINQCCVSREERLEKNSVVGVASLLSSYLGSVVISVLSVQKKVLWLIKENGNNKSIN